MDNSQAQQAAEDKYPRLNNRDTNRRIGFVAGAQWQSSQTPELFGCAGGNHDIVPILGNENVEIGEQCRRCGVKIEPYKAPAALPVVDNRATNQDIFKACEMVWQHIYKIYNLTDENTTTVMTSFILNTVLPTLKITFTPVVSGGEKMYRWVKPSIRNPKQDGEYFCMVQYAYRVLGDLKKVAVEFKDNCWGLHEDNYVVEWLEKVSPSQLPSPVRHIESAEDILSTKFLSAFRGYNWDNVMSTGGDWKDLMELSLRAMEEYANQFKGTTPLNQ